MKRTRIFDWRFILAVTVLAMVAYLIWFAASSVKDGHESDERADAAISLLREEQKSSKLSRVTATAERAMLLEKQDQLLAQLSRLQRKQNALLDYLRTQGIAIPASFTASSARSSSGGDNPKGRGKAKGRR